MGAEQHAVGQNWSDFSPEFCPDFWSGGWTEAGGWADPLPSETVPSENPPGITAEAVPSGAVQSVAVGPSGAGDAMGFPEEMGFPEDVPGGGWAQLVVLDEPSSSPLHGSVGLPAAASLSAAEALAVVECAERVIGWASAAKLEALARLGAALAEEVSDLLCKG